MYAVRRGLKRTRGELCCTFVDERESEITNQAAFSPNCDDTVPDGAIEVSMGGPRQYRATATVNWAKFAPDMTYTANAY